MGHDRERFAAAGGTTETNIVKGAIAMYLSRFGVKNYKCLGEIDIPLTPIHVLIGQNDCGKTSLLEAMAAFFASSEERLGDTFPGPWSGPELVRHGVAATVIEFSGEWVAGADDKPNGVRLPLRYRLGVDFSNETGEGVCHQEEIETREERRSLLDSDRARLGLTSVARWKREDTYPKGVAPADLYDLSAVLKPAHKYALNARQMAIPAGFDPARRFKLSGDGFGLPTLLDDLLGHDPTLYLRMRDAFIEYFPQFKTVRLKTETALHRSDDPAGLSESRKGHGKGIELEMRNGKTVRAQQASDGAILFLGFLALAHLPDPPNLLLIEEPENGIYPTRLRELITLLKQLVNRTEGVRFPQIILTTHSPYVLSFFEPEEVTLLSPLTEEPDAPVRARPLREAPEIKERMAEDELYLGELWYNFTEKELFGDP
jgi:predicted ATPase